MSLSLPHALSVWWRNATMYRRTWKLNILPNFFEPVFYLASIGIGVGAYIQQMGGMSYAQFLAPGLICVAAMNGASFEVTYNVFVRLHLGEDLRRHADRAGRARRRAGRRGAVGADARLRSTAAPSSSSWRPSATRRCRARCWRCR